MAVANFSKDQWSIKVDKAQVLNLEKLLKEVAGVMTKQKYKQFRTKVAREGGKIIQKEIKNRIPKRRTPLGVTGRYSTPKLFGKMKAPKGMGIMTTYQPVGTAKKSVKVFQSRLNRKFSDVTVGPMTKRNNKNPRFDGWYVRFLEQGTTNYSAQRPVKRGLIAGKDRALRTMEKLLIEKFDSVGKNHGNR